MASSDPAWLDLRLRIETQVRLEPTSVELGERTFQWYRVANPDVLLDLAVEQSAECSRPEIDPFWAATWRAALGLDQFLSSVTIRDVRVLELGCGSGQAGTGAAARGAWVTLTDSVQLALDVAQLNSWPVRDRVKVEKLTWGETQISEPRFPIILGSDLVYDTSLFPLLEQCAREHLTPQGKLLLSEPHRHTGDHFAKWIREHGWLTREHDVDLKDDRIPVRIFECQLG